MSKVKTSLHAFDISAIVKEFSCLLGAKVVNIYGFKDLVYIRFRCRDASVKYVVVDPTRRISFTKYLPSQTEIAGVVKVLRSLIRDLTVLEVRQVRLDRIVAFRVGSGDKTYRVIFEVMKRPNIIVTDDNLKILYALKEARLRDRAVVKGETYVPPPSTDIREVSLDAFLSKLRESQRKLSKTLVQDFSIPGEVAQEAIYRVGLASDPKACEVAEADARALYDAIMEIFREYSTGPYAPRIYVEGGKPVTVSPIKLRAFEERGAEAKCFGSFSDAVDEYFKSIVEEILRESARKKYEAEIGRLEATIKDLETKVEGFLREAEALSSTAEKMFASLHLAFQVQKPPKPLKDALEKFFSELSSVCGVKLSLKGVNYERGVVTLGISDKATVTLSISDALNPSKLASALYSRAKELREKASRAEKTLNELREKLRELMAKMEEEVSASEVEEAFEVRREWFERFRWFLTSDGFLVIAGKDANQNEVIARKYLEPRDIFLHADIHGGAITVLKTEGREVPQRSIEEAAKFAAAYSRAWSLGYSAIDVYWVYGEQVSKRPPPGQYLAKGAFMVYGRRNYIRGVKLEIAVGLAKVRDSIKLMSAPPEAMKGYGITYAVLVPGRRRKTEVAKEVLETLLKRVEDKAFRKWLSKKGLDHLLQLIPGDSAEILEVRS